MATIIQFKQFVKVQDVGIFSYLTIALENGIALPAMAQDAQTHTSSNFKTFLLYPEDEKILPWILRKQWGQMQPHQQSMIDTKQLQINPLRNHQGT